MKIVYLEPKSTFRTHLRSDTLWGTLCWAIRMVYGNKVLEDIIKSYNEDNPDFVISSAFPFCKNGKEKMRFFPKPIIKDEKTDLDNVSRKERIKLSQIRKKIKKVSFLNEVIYSDVMNGKRKLQDILFDVINSMGIEKSPAISSDSITHLTIDRINGGSLELENGGQLFHTEELYFNMNPSGKLNAGYFFLIKGNTEIVEGALRFLNHVGIGGDRNIGKGVFNIYIEEYEINEPEDFNALTNLSLYIPTQDELKRYYERSPYCYILEERQGFMSFLKHDKFHKPAKLMFKEGSVFPNLKKENYGYNPIVRPKSPTQAFNVYQYGNGFMIKMKI